MSANTFGNLFRVTTFGESHGPAMGVVIDGCPAGIPWDQTLLEQQLERRRPGYSAVVSQRKEPDVPKILSGVFEGKTLGTPIAIIVESADAQSGDYDKIKNNPRPGHADDVWKNKFGHTDHRGGGRTSGRETVSRVMAGAVARMVASELTSNIKVLGFASQIGPIELTAEDKTKISLKDGVDQFVARFPGEQNKQVEALLLEAREQGKSYGGTAEIWAEGVPEGLGQPVFKKFKSDFAMALMSVGATAGFEIGDGMQSTKQEGSEFHQKSNSPYGGLRGGITTGEPLKAKVYFKPTSSVLDVAKQGRHDPCIVPRAIPVLEAMTWITLADHLLWRRLDQVN